MLETAKQGGKGWRPRLSSFKEEMIETWGEWGVSSEIGRLRSVLLRRPGSEIDHIVDYNAALWTAPMDPALARIQHDNLANAYQANGVNVYYIGTVGIEKPNSHFVRDLLLMTPEGAIVSRPASKQRAGEEKFVFETLGQLGVPVLMTIHGDGTFEGADVALIDPELAILAEGQRTNGAGADQVEWALHQVGYKQVIRVRLLPPYLTVHLDGVFCLVDIDLALIHPQRTPTNLVDALRDREFRILEMSLEDHHMPGNGVVLSPGNIIIPAGNPHTKRQLEEVGCTVIEIDIREIQKSGGGIHCMTGFLRRDDQ